MTHFDCDYMAGAHPEVLEAIVNFVKDKKIG